MKWHRYALYDIAYNVSDESITKTMLLVSLHVFKDSPYLDRIILKVEVDFTFSDSELFLSPLDDGLLEERIEGQNLPVERQPGRKRTPLP